MSQKRMKNIGRFVKGMWGLLKKSPQEIKIIRKKEVDKYNQIVKEIKELHNIKNLDQKEVKNFDQIVEDIEKHLILKLKNKEGYLDDEWLKCLYNNYHSRFLSDNERIWGNGRIMIPFSLSAFGLYANLDKPDFLQVLILGLASSGLIALWLVNAESHRAFQNKSMAWLVAIENVIVGKDLSVPVKVYDDKMTKLLAGDEAVRNGIKWLCYCLPRVWVVLLIISVF